MGVDKVYNVLILECRTSSSSPYAACLNISKNASYFKICDYFFSFSVSIKVSTLTLSISLIDHFWNVSMVVFSMKFDLSYFFSEDTWFSVLFYITQEKRWRNFTPFRYSKNFYITFMKDIKNIYICADIKIWCKYIRDLSLWFHYRGGLTQYILIFVGQVWHIVYNTFSDECIWK